MASKAGKRTQNGRNWARTGILAGVTVVVLVLAFGGDLEYKPMIALGALVALPLLGWFIGLSIPVDD